nr:carbohydrate ABC transporter permease [Vallitalea okinawensis]
MSENAMTMKNSPTLKKKGFTYREIGKIVVHTLLIIGAISMIFPFIWMILTSLKTFGEATRIPPTILPSEWMVENYTKVLNVLPFTQLYINTILMMLGRVIFAVVTCSMAGYAFARIKFPGSKIMFGLILAQMMVPGQVFTIPQYLLVADLGMLNTIFALIFPGLISCFGVFLLRQFYLSLPNELEEAAIIDGCNDWKIFTRIMFPLTKASVSALTIFTAIWAYKDLMWPIIVNISMDKMTLSAGLATLNGQYVTDYPVIMAGTVLSMWPILILYVIFQRQFVEGIAMTGTKG